MPRTTIRKIRRSLASAERSGVHYHGGVTGRVHLCDDARCQGSGRGSTRWGT